MRFPGATTSPRANVSSHLRGAASAKSLWVVVVLAGIALLVAGASLLNRRSYVVLYASQDQVFVEPILRDFERESGIRVRAVFDSEAAKTVAIANRLLAERAHPQCDVFWANEEFRSRQLAAAGLFRETNGWAGFGYRSRRLALSGKAASQPPIRSLVELTNGIFRRRVAMAYPLFGTTATHLMALRQHWGESNWLEWCRAFAANEPFVVDGNSVAAQFATRGEVAVALTDSDDIAAEIREGAKLIQLPMTAETLLIPNTVGVIRGCPHPESAEKLFEYLREPRVVERLIAAHALEGTAMSEVTTQTLKPDWDKMLRELEPATQELRQLFRR